MIEFIGMPFLSAFLFVMGGILVGHLLWYRDRSTDLQTAKDAESKYAKAKAAARSRKSQWEALQGDLQSLESTRHSLAQENESLRASLRNEKEQIQTLVSQIGSMRSEQGRFELSAQDASAAREETIQKWRQSEQELAKVRDQLADRDDEIDQLRRSQTEIESRHAAACEKLNELASAAEAAGDDLAQRHTTIEQLRAENGTLQTAQQSLQERFDELLTANDQLQSAKATTEHDAATLREQMGDLEADLNEARALMDELTLQRNAALAQRDQFAEERNSVSEQTDVSIAEHNAKYEALMRQYDEALAKLAAKDETIQRSADAIKEHELQMQALQSEHDETLEQLDERTARIQEAIDGRVVAETAIGELERQVEEAQQEIQTLTADRDRQARSLADISFTSQEAKERTTQLTSTLAAKDERVKSLETQLATASAAIAKHRGEVERLQAFRPEFEKLRQTAQEQAEQLRLVGSEVTAAKAREVQLRTELETRVAEQTAAVTRLRDELKAAEEKAARAKQFEPQTIALRANVTEIKAELKRVSEELNSSLDANASMQDRVRQLETQLHENAAVMRDLRRKRAHVPTLDTGESIRKAA